MAARISALNETTARLLSKSNTPATAVTATSASRPVLDISEIVKQQFKKRSEKHLALFSFLARLYPNDKCGSNGLPLTPNSIRVYGRFQYLKLMVSKYLCRYIDMQRGNQERLYIVSEHYSLTMNDLLNDTYIYNLIITNMNVLIKWIYQIMRAFNYLNKNRILNRYVHLKYICITPKGSSF
jgi:TBC domain-containing protein kinase-like protein